MGAIATRVGAIATVVGWRPSEAIASRLEAFALNISNPSHLEQLPENETLEIGSVIASKDCFSSTGVVPFRPGNSYKWDMGTFSLLFTFVH